MGRTTKRREPPLVKTPPEDYAGICGLYWEGHAGYEASPITCGTQEDGALGNLCPVYVCAKLRGVAHCGVCPEFPCFLLVNLAAQGTPDDPRIDSAALRAEVGDEQWAAWARRRQLWCTAFCPLWRRVSERGSSRSDRAPDPPARAAGAAGGAVEAEEGASTRAGQETPAGQKR